MNDYVNFAITSFIFLFLATFLAVKEKSTTTILGILLLAFLLSVYLGSFSAMVLVGVSSALTLATLTSVYRGLLDFPVSGFWSIILLILISLIFLFLFKKTFNIKIWWGLNLTATLFSAIFIYLLADFRLFQRAGSVSALYAWEDNAAWVATTHRALTQNQSVNGGEYGSLLDSILWISHTVSLLAFPALTTIDHLATAVIISTLLLCAAIPFLAILPSFAGAAAGKGSVSSTAVLSIGSYLGFLQLNSIGHLSTAISCLLLTVYLCVTFTFPDDGHSLRVKQFSLSLQIFLAYLAGVTWWPIAPLSAALIVFSIWKSRKYFYGSKKSFSVYVTFSSTLIYLLIYEELLRRFKGAQSSDDGFASGASFLLGVVGGNTETQPWNLLVITLYSMILLLLFVALGLKFNTGIISFALLFAYVYVIKFINLRLDEGVSAYGSRKLEIVLILIGASFLSWALVALFEKYLANNLSPLIPALLVLVFLLSMPVAYAIIPSNYYAGLDWKPNVKTSKAISKNVEVGRSTVCLNETYQSDPGSELRVAAYLCSRWTAAYSDTDTVPVSNWRFTVIGGTGGQNEALRISSDALPTDTMLIVVGPEDIDREKNNPEWNWLVQEEWLVVR